LGLPWDGMRTRIYGPWDGLFALVSLDTAAGSREGVQSQLCICGVIGGLGVYSSIDGREQAKQVFGRWTIPDCRCRANAKWGKWGIRITEALRGGALAVPVQQQGAARPLRPLEVLGSAACRPKPHWG
jgi:hypothetical protein